MVLFSQVNINLIDHGTTPTVELQWYHAISILHLCKEILNGKKPLVSKY